MYQVISLPLTSFNLLNQSKNDSDEILKKNQNVKYMINLQFISIVFYKRKPKL